MKNSQKKYGAIKNELPINDDDEKDTILVKTNSSSNKCKCNYLIEPVAFIYNLASSIISISLGQFIYAKILNRLIEQENTNHNHTANSSYFFSPKINNYYSNLYTITQTESNISQVCSNINPNRTNISTELILNSFYVPTVLNESNSLPPDIMNRIQTQAQIETAHLYFEMAVYSSIPVILMTNLMGVNCSNLGRKFLMIIYLTMLSLRYLLFLLQCLFPMWPDYLFYIGAFLEGISGGSGILYLAFFSCISDLTSAKSRSFRISLLVNINSAASLCTLYICGIVIKYYGYLYLFITSLSLILFALMYTIFLVPETLVELKHKSILSRIRSCSIKRCFNCVKVYFDEKKSDRDELITPATKEDDDTETFLLLSKKKQPYKKQTWVLLTIVLANFIYNFGTNGVGSIFTLFIMNSPYCFDSIEISKYQVFSTLVSLIFSMIVSKFIRINDLIICCLSVISYFGSVFFYIYGDRAIHIYAGALVSSIAGLQYTYARSIVSKSVAKHEVSDALCLILIVDTFIGVLSIIIFPIIYSKLVTTGVATIFWFSNIFILLTFILNFICYFLYVPKKEEHFIIKERGNDIQSGRKNGSKFYVSNSDDDLLNESLNAAAKLNSSGMILEIKQ